MIRSMYKLSEGEIQRDLTTQEICNAIADPAGLLWVSLEYGSTEEIHSILGDVFHFHPLAIEDVESTGYQTPKVDDFTDYLFIITHALETHNELNGFETKELNCFLGSNYLVTSYLEPEMKSVQMVWKRCDKDERLLNHGPDFLMHAILDANVDEFMPLLDELDQTIEDLEDQVLEKPKTATLIRILDLKHSLIVLRRMISPQREVMNRLSRDDFPQIDRTSRIYFRDIYDHMVRYQDMIESLRDLVSDALSTYMSAISNRLNEIMKALTIVSTIFLPLSFVAGVYGMNFEYMPELHWRYGYLAVWLVFILIALGMIYYFKKREWF